MKYARRNRRGREVRMGRRLTHSHSRQPNARRTEGNQTAAQSRQPNTQRMTANRPAAQIRQPNARRTEGNQTAAQSRQPGAQRASANQNDALLRQPNARRTKGNQTAAQSRQPGAQRASANQNDALLRQPNGRRTGRRIVWRRFLPALLCLGLFAFGAVRLIVYFAHSHGVKQANAELQAIYEESHSAASKSTALASLAPESTAVPTLASELASESTPEPSVQPIATLKPEYQLVSEEIRPEMRALFAKNRDLVAWLRISGVVSLPVVYRDNTYYLTHDFDRKSSSAGTLFLDELHPLVPKTQHLVIHGHNMYDGTMFGLLSHARKLDFVRDHGFASLNTLYREERYVLFCVNSVPENVNAGGYIAYTDTPTFRTEHQFNAFIQALREHSFYEIPIEVTPADALLTLSTCLDDERLILTYRRVREGESEESLQMQLNQSA